MTPHAPPGPEATPARSILKTNSYLALARTSDGGASVASSASATPTKRSSEDAQERGEFVESARVRSFVTFAGVGEDESDAQVPTAGEGSFNERVRGLLFGGASSRDAANAPRAMNGKTAHVRRDSFTTAVPEDDEEEDGNWFLSIGVDTRSAMARVMESRLQAAQVEEERLRELVHEAHLATKKAEREAEKKRREEEEDEDEDEDEDEADESPVAGASDIVAPVLQPWDVMVTVARAREGDAQSAANRANLVCKKLAHTVALWESKSAKRAYLDMQKHLQKMKEKKGRRLADAARTREAATTAKDEFERELADMRVLEDKRLAADVLMAEASANMHTARTTLQNARDRKRGILSTFRQAVRSSVDASVDLLEFRQTEFALRATNVTKTMFNAYDEMTTRLENALINAIDAGGRHSPRKPKHERVLDIEAAAALTARDRAEASLNDATSQCMAEMRALEASTRTLLSDVDAEIKAGIADYYAAAEHERKCYMEAQRATIACKESHAACDVYEDAAAATEQMSSDADRWAASLDHEIEALQTELLEFEARHIEAEAHGKAALLEVENAEAEIEKTNAPVNADPRAGRFNSVKSAFDGITNFSTIVRDKATRQDSDTIASLKQLSIQAGLDSPRVSDSMSMLGFRVPDADMTVESIMEKAEELQKSQDVQHLTRTVSRNALAYNPLQDR